ncbi:MAG: tRNA (adenosine(37)-N6)-threonylcarbamoyltransferase complex dimerization subunit type 1 TsaB [Clostridiales bacterium]|mgnify:CR=1 FL=1|nr:tRNA (adenosine(37)-N6)-threonylcarbamoyltransferase complex dimerization subunit type 1 TsaB [Clostridiales bacterium]
MKLLALDSSGLVASVAIVTEDAVLAEYTVNFKKTHSQTLLPMLEEITKMIDLDLSEVDGIAVAEGPGSFTGLRIGSATAKGLGLALGVPIIPVPTLNGLAYNLFGTDHLICPMMDARRNQVYTGLYDFHESSLRILVEQKAAAIEDMIAQINQMGKGVIYLGDGTSVYKNIIQEQTKVEYQFAPAHLSRQRASAIGCLGIQYYKQNKVQTAAEHSPIYLRLSQAERERQEKINDKLQRTE